MFKKSVLPSRPSNRTALTWVSIVLLAASFGSAASAESPIFEARFNDLAGLDLQNGATLGAGVSGQIADKSYTADVSTLAEPQESPRVAFTIVRPGDPLTEFTITAWYNPRVTPENDATLFDLLGTTLLWEEKTNQWVLRIDAKAAADPKLPMYWFRSGNKAPLGSWSSPDQWNFIAMVWKRADKSVLFFQGGMKTPVSIAAQVRRSEDVEPLLERANAKRVIGNSSSSSSKRPFDGSIDNFRFYGHGLNEAALEKIRQADLKDQQPALP